MVGSLTILIVVSLPVLKFNKRVIMTDRTESSIYGMMYLKFRSAAGDHAFLRSYIFPRSLRLLVFLIFQLELRKKPNT